MPCYDHRNDPSYIRAELQEDTKRQVEKARVSFLHNSPVAELLCFTLSNLDEATRRELINGEPKLGYWWRDHQERDRKRKNKPPAVAPKRKRTVR